MLTIKKEYSATSVVTTHVMVAPGACSTCGGGNCTCSSCCCC